MHTAQFIVHVMARISLLLLSLLPLYLSIPQPPKTTSGKPVDIHIDVDIAETLFDFTNDLLTMHSVLTLGWTDEGNPYVPKKQDSITHIEGDFEWPLDLQFSDMWIPDIKTSIENNEYRATRMKMSEATFRRNGSVEVKYFYTALIPCDQRSLSYPWDEFHCGIFLANMESVRMYTLSSIREKPFDISYNRPMSQHRILAHDSTIRSTFTREREKNYRIHGAHFECTVQRDQPRIIYSNVIPALSLVFFDIYIFITNQTSPLYNLLVAIPLILQVQFFSKLLVNKLPYLVIFLLSRTFLSISTSLGRILLIILAKFYPDQVKTVIQYDTVIYRIAIVVVSTFVVFLAIDYAQ